VTRLQRYQSRREILRQVERVLATTAGQWRNSPLDEVAGILSRGRDYEWVGIYLRVNGSGPEEARRGAAGLVAPIHVGRRMLGVIEVTGAHQHHEDGLLLKEVAARLARFLSGNGKWLLRKLREAATAART
jgi:hypothetical protein